MIGFIGTYLQLQLTIIAHTLNSFLMSDESLTNPELISTLTLSLSLIHESTAFYNCHAAIIEFTVSEGSITVFHECGLGNHVLIWGNTLIPPSMFTVSKRVLTIRCLAMDYFVTM
jgi:hypothetical protein